MSEATKPEITIGSAVLMRGINGPHMQVLDINLTTGIACCCWFDKEMKRHDGLFPLACLMLTESWPEHVGRAKAETLAKVANHVKSADKWSPY